MSDTRLERWEKARQALIRRWENILTRIEAKDEAGVTELAAVMDEFCDEAAADRERGATPVVSETSPLRRTGSPGAGGVGSLCVFCEGYREADGCLGVVGALNRAVFAADWEGAARVASDYLDRLRTMKMGGPGASASI